MGRALELDKVCVRYADSTALAELSLTVSVGERVALVGPSGAGKSTLLGLGTGRVRATSGRVTVLGQDLESLVYSRLQSLRRRLAEIPQELGLIDPARSLENMHAANPRRTRWWQVLRDQVSPPRAETLRAYEILDSLGIGDKAFQPVARLSGGERQRVAVARALFREPALLLADEPVASVDPTHAQKVLARLLSDPGESTRTWIVSLHQPQLVGSFFDRVIGLRNGRLIFDGPASSVSASDWRELYGSSPVGLG